MPRPSSVNKVPADQVSFVLQGPIGSSTKGCVESIRRHFPGAEIVVSTWQGSDADSLGADAVIYSVDPGGLEAGAVVGGGFVTNLNRQIVSARAGLERSTREWVVKTRTDIEWLGDGFLEALVSYPAHGDSHILKERIVACTRVSVDSRRAPYAMHVSDWVHAGRRDDVLRLWSAPLVDEEFAQYFATRDLPSSANLWGRGWYLRYAPEQYLLVNLVRNAGHPVPEHIWDVSRELTVETEKILADNFILLEPDEFALRFTKYKWPVANWANCYTSSEWRGLYKKYCEQRGFGVWRQVRRSLRDVGSWTLVSIRGSKILRKVLGKASI